MTQADLRYRAFISYSHRDAVVTQRLHRRLETYSVPRPLRGVADDGHVVPARIHPVFRDRDELASAAQLSRSIQEALDASEALVVVCSPSAVASPWVGEEVAYFRRQHPARPVFAFVVAGDPGLDPRRDPARAAFPATLLLEDPSSDAALGEPVAADARDEGDGFAAAFLKLAAGLLGVRYDQLRRRDQRRRQQRWTLIITFAILIAAVFAFLAWQATVARDEAQRARARAELELESERQTREFLLSVFHLADANEARGEQVTVREVLDRAVERIDDAAFNRPAIRSRYLATMGQAYSSLGLNKRSIVLLRDSIDALDDVAADGEARLQRAESRIALADTLFDMGEYDAALEQTALLASGSRDEAPTAEQRIRIANIRGDVLSYLERDEEANQAYVAALAGIDAAALPATPAALARARSEYGLAQLALFAGDAANAERRLTESGARLDAAVGELHPDSIATTISLGSAAYRNGHRTLARSVWGRALANASRVYDAGSPHLGTLSNNLGLLLLEDGDLAAAEPLLRDALASDRKHRSEDFDDLAYPLHNLGYLLLAQDRLDEAQPLLEEGVRIADAKGHRMLAPLLNALADLYCLRGDVSRGLPLAERAVRVGDADADAAPWRMAQARLTRSYCATLAGTQQEPDARAVTTADMTTLAAKWMRANPFVRRARAQQAAMRD